MGYLLGLIFCGIPLYLMYKDRQNRSPGFFNSKTGKRLSNKEFKNIMDEGQKIYEDILDEPITNNSDRKKEDNEEVKVKYYENGQRKEEINYKNGEKNGFFNRWYKNGQKDEERPYTNGKIDGLWTTWYENGQTLFQKPYKDGKIDGLVTYWFSNGQKWFEENWKNGKWVGLWTTWYENGQKKSEKNYNDGKLISKKEWNEDGSVKE